MNTQTNPHDNAQTRLHRSGYKKLLARPPFVGMWFSENLRLGLRKSAPRLVQSPWRGHTPTGRTLTVPGAPSPLAAAIDRHPRGDGPMGQAVRRWSERHIGHTRSSMA